MNPFEIELKQLALRHAPTIIGNVGDIVETVWSDWKRPHNVKIYEIGIEIVKLNPRARISEPLESVDDWIQAVGIIGVDLYYYALRLNKDGTARNRIGHGIVLTNFVTSDSQQWQKKYCGFNHVGLCWTIERLKNNENVQI